MNVKFCAFIIAVFFFASAGAQDVGDVTGNLTSADSNYIKLKEDTLGLLSFAFVNSDSDTLRFAAVQKFIPMLVSALKKPNSFSYPFDRLKSVSVIYPVDSAFRVFSWQLDVTQNERRYYGAIQLNGAELKLIPLIDRSFTIENEQEITNNRMWPGMIYYNALPFVSDGQTKYLLFGYDHMSLNQKRKVVDILTLDSSATGATFGAPLFVKPDDEGDPYTSNRLVLEYFAETTIGANYDPHLEMIIHDHLTLVAGPEGPIKVPDGTYEGYKLENGKWIHVHRVFNTSVDEPPRPQPILKGREGKDLLGKD